jgi:putative redox protein
MTEKTHRVHLEQIGRAAFEASASTGGKLVVDGSPDIGGEGKGMRPMELLLSAVASCSAMDVLHILRKQREPLARLEVEVEGVRADAVPSPFTRIKLSFRAYGAVDDHKLQRAVGLAVEKYCSAVATLNAGATVTWEAHLADRSEGTER